VVVNHAIEMHTAGSKGDRCVAVEPNSMLRIDDDINCTVEFVVEDFFFIIS
jgi:hypothetical protein